MEACTNGGNSKDAYERKHSQLSSENPFNASFLFGSQIKFCMIYLSSEDNPFPIESNEKASENSPFNSPFQLKSIS